MLLGDGGVYDNMAEEWLIGVAERNADWAALTPGLAEPREVVVVNASAKMRWRDRPSLTVPWLGELTNLLAVKDVLYDQTTSTRRRGLLRRFWAAEASNPAREPALDGVMVQIDRSPFALPGQFAAGTDEKAGRARAALAALAGEDKAAWEALVQEDAGIKTTLSALGVDRAAALLRHAYALTMVNTHVVLGYPLVPIPALAAFARLAGAA
jgi:hypothetical protein